MTVIPHPSRHIVQQLRDNAHRQHDCFGQVTVGLGDWRDPGPITLPAYMYM